MRYGDLVNIQSDGIQIESKELEPIGIYPNSDCWGVILPDWDHEAPQQATNILISPFHPSSWPILIRLVLRLWRPGGKDGDGALHRAASVLAREGLNILSYDCTPSGYHHLTWTLVGEHEELRNAPRKTLDPGDALAGGRVLGNKHLREYSQQTLAPEMLRYGQLLARALLKANERERFLHSAFLDPDRAFGGRLYDPQQLEPDVRADGLEQGVRPIRWRWLQDMAFFWLYGDAESQPMLIRYEADSHSLKIREGWDRTTYGRALSPLSGVQPTPKPQPSRTLALFDTDEQYVRVLLDPRQKVQVRASYNVDVRNQGSTRGLLRDVLRHLQDSGVGVLHVANSTRRREDNAEMNSMDFIGDISGAGADAIEAVETRLQHKTVDSVWLKQIHLEPRLISPHYLFVSTRLEWERWGEEVRNVVIEIAQRYGFVPVIIDELQPSFRLPFRKHGAEDYLLAEANDAIRRSRAFLQIIPQLGKDGKASKDEPFRWMNMELGLALGCDLPRAICLDVALGNTIANFEKRLVTAGYRVFPFESNKGLADIRRVISGAVQRLARRVAEGVE